MKSNNVLETGLKAFGILWVMTIAALGVLIYRSNRSTYAAAQPVVVVIFVAFLALGVGAVVLMQHKKWRWSGLVLIASAATPAGFAYIGNVLALFIGLWLLLAGAGLAKRTPGNAPTRWRPTHASRSASDACRHAAPGHG